MLEKSAKHATSRITCETSTRSCSLMVETRLPVSNGILTVVWP